METGAIFESVPSDGSECCCQPASDDGLKDFGCAERKYVLTPREQVVLSRIREAVEKARSVKKEMQRLGEGPEDLEARQRALQELDGLRQLRASLEEERIAAAEERMRMLGHA